MPRRLGGQKNAQFKLIEARCGGYVKNSKKTAKIGDSVTCVGFMPDLNETPTLSPNGWVHNVTNRKELPPQPMYRWYVTRDVVDIPDDDDAVIMQAAGYLLGASRPRPPHTAISDIRTVGIPSTTSPCMSRGLNSRVRSATRLGLGIPRSG